jgi:hypothetical protein
MSIKSQDEQANGTSEPWVRHSLLFQRWEAMKQDILLHKWYESEKVGHDIGWERAAVDWMVRYGCHKHPEKTD